MSLLVKIHHSPCVHKSYLIWMMWVAALVCQHAAPDSLSGFSHSTQGPQTSSSSPYLFCSAGLHSLLSWSLVSTPAPQSHLLQWYSTHLPGISACAFWPCRSALRHTFLLSYCSHSIKITPLLPSSCLKGFNLVSSVLPRFQFLTCYRWSANEHELMILHNSMGKW